MAKKKKKKVPAGYHMMPDGHIMSDKEMEEYHRTRGASMIKNNMLGGKMSKLSVALGKNK